MSLSLGASCCLESLIVTMVYFVLQLHYYGHDNGFIPNANLAQNYGLRKH